MTSYGDYEKYAQQCIEMSEVTSGEAKQQLKKMAEIWLELARTKSAAPSQPDTGKH